MCAFQQCTDVMQHMNLSVPRPWRTELAVLPQSCYILLLIIFYRFNFANIAAFSSVTETERPES